VERTQEFPAEWGLAIRREFEMLAKIDARGARIVVYRVIELRTWEDVARLEGIKVSKARDDYEYSITWLRDRLS
jgi:midasin (ATPase involved in ribosome maturation)